MSEPLVAEAHAPRFTPPAGACDTHLHFYGPLERYPAVHDPAYPVPDATPEQFIALQDAAGLQRAVIVHATATGRDNRRTLDALREHPARFRGIVTPMLEGHTDAQLAAWDRLGVRGVRYSYVGRPAPGMAIDEVLVERCTSLGWHAQVHVEGDQIIGLEPRLRALPCPVVIDHIARIPAAAGIGSAAFRCLLRLVDSGRVWVKLSAPMRMSSDSYPYADVMPFAKELVRCAPERLLWGTDWPNVNFTGEVPSYGRLLDLLADWAPDARDRQRILVDNPQALYRFGD